MKYKKSPWSNLGLVANFIGTVVAGSVSLFALRENNLTMLDLREDVIAADESGEGVSETLTALQTYIASHMNTNPPHLGSEPAIQLIKSFERAKKAESDRVSSERTTVANDAAVYCEQNIRNVQLSVRADCVADYTSQRPVTEKQIVADLYRYDFVSPRWTPDLAGLSLLVSIVLGSIFVIQLLSRSIATFLIKR